MHKCTVHVLEPHFMSCCMYLYEYSKKKQDACYIFIFESAANCFSFAVAGVNESMESHDRKYTTHLSVLSRPAPHLVKARLPAYLSLSLCSKGKQTRPTYTQLQKHLAACMLILSDLPLKNRSQVNWGESHVLFVSQHFLPCVSVRLTFSQNTAYGPAFLNNNKMRCQTDLRCQGSPRDHFTWDDPSLHNVTNPMGVAAVVTPPIIM